MKTSPQSAVKPPNDEKAFGSTIEWLKDRIETYLKINKKTGLTDAGFGYAAIKDTGLVDRLRQGGDVTTRKFDAIVRYMGNPKHKDCENGKQSKKQIAKKEGK